MKTFTSQEIKEFVSKPLFDEKVILNKDPSWPKISIVTPSYNQAQFLERTILSVLNQNYPNLEYIIIDGGSTDGTLNIIKKYENKIAYWISEPDKGMYNALNKGLRIASGEILAYINSDDLYLPNTFFFVVGYFQKNIGTTLIYGDCIFINENGDHLYTYRYLPFKFYRYVALNWSSIPQPTTFWRNTVHKTEIYFDENFKMLGDFDFYIKVGQQFRIEYVKKEIAVFRLHKGSLTLKHRQLRLSELSKMRKKYDILYNKKGIKLMRYIGELQIKMVNFPLMVKKFFGKKYEIE